jgi:LuxR family transcriptional regulator, maltose regulon positive regulatory protein
VTRRATAVKAQSRRAALAPVPQLPVFDFLESKIQVPTLRPGLVSRTPLVNKLRATTSVPVVTVVAPAGYGKTTLLSQWAAKDSRAFAWLTIDDRDNDPIVLLRHIAASLSNERPVDERVVDALRSRPSSIWSSAVPRIAAELSARSPIVLVLDDLNLLRSKDSLELIAALIDDESEGSMLVVAGRVPPKLPLAPLRASGRLLELGADELALTKREAQLLLTAAGVRLGQAETAELIERCEGWAAALYLAALSIRDGKQTTPEVVRFAGDDRYLADYFRSEYLSHLRPGPLRFLRRTSVLDRMCGALCDAVLEDEESARELRSIERANLFLVALDNRREWYRYHHLFHELLQRELAEQEPDLVPELHSRAAEWFLAHGDNESALEHAFQAGDTDRAAEILVAIAFAVYSSGRVATLEKWFRRFERAGLLDRYPAVALHGCCVHALRNRPEQARRYLDAATASSSSGRMPDGSPSIKSWIAVVRAWLCPEGAKQMLADADTAVEELADESDWLPGAFLVKGAALSLLGEYEQADETLASAVERATAHGTTVTHILSLGQRALVAAEVGDHTVFERLVDETQTALRTSEVEEPPALAIERAVTARLMLRRGRWNEAREALTAAQVAVASLGAATPWLAAQIRIELAQGFIALRDADAAEEMLDEAGEVLEEVPGLGGLETRADEIRGELSAIPSTEEANRPGLTPAELRLLPLLATHLSFREIAEQLFVSRNTIKTQAISVYRKLGVTSRSEAIAEARRLGLGDHLRVLIAKSK